jgi:hypothetical protein
MNVSAKWLWIVFALLTLTFGLNIQNPFLETVRTISHFVILILAITASFFGRKKEAKN